MLHKILLRNKRTQESIVIDREGSSAYVLDEYDFGYPKIEPSTYKIPFQIGSSLSGLSVNSRPVDIQGYVIAETGKMNTGDMTISEYYEEQNKRIFESKEILNNLINVNDEIEIVCGDYFLTGVPTQPPLYATKENRNNEALCLFQIAFECYSPLFKKAKGADVQVKSVQKAFHFPMALLEDNTIFGIIDTTAKTLEIVNSGQGKEGMNIYFNFYEPATGYSVSITNITNGEKLTIDYKGTISENDFIVVKTGIGEEDILFHDASEGMETSIVSSLVLMETSAFPKLEQGTNHIAFSTMTNADVRIDYEEGVYNIKEM